MNVERTKLERVLSATEGRRSGRMLAVCGVLVLGCSVDSRFEGVPAGQDYVPSGSSPIGGGPGGGGPGTGGNVMVGAGGGTGGELVGGGGIGGVVTGGGPGTGASSGSGGAMPGSGGTNPSSGGSGPGTGGSTSIMPETIYSGTGVKVGASSNSVGIDGGFVLLEDSVKDGEPVIEPVLILSDLDPTTGSFDEPSTFASSSEACIYGAVAAVTASDGFSCNAEFPCEWEKIWGGGIALELNDPTGTSPGAWNAQASGVKGFEFHVTGQVDGVPMRVEIVDTSGEIFCKELSLGPSSFTFAELEHNCWDPDGMQLDLTKVRKVQWRLVAEPDTEHLIDDFCVNQVGVF